jgi:hypothetical protein
VESIHEIFKMPWVQGLAGVIEGLTAQVRELYAQGLRALPLRQLDAHIERTLLQQRHFQKRTVLGQSRIRCLLSSGSQGSPAVAAYLPEGLARDLPTFQRFTARIVAEIRPQLDQYESSAHALRVILLGRVIRRG